MNIFRKKNVTDILAELEANENKNESLGKFLTQKDLIFFGIAAIVGAGVFSTIGQASYDGGPAVIFLFMFTALACGFAAMAYAEFASMVPVSGSAYTYSYVAFGEMIAWIIGWSLIMEYAVGNITLAISWSDYFTGLLSNMGIHLPQWIQMDYLSANKGFNDAIALMASGKSFENLPTNIQLAHTAWTTAPQIGTFHFVADIPALGIIFLITWLVYRGMKESRNASNIMVFVKLAVIALVLVVGVFYVDMDNFDPFAPNGFSGVLKGVSAVFFAYIGFDAISTTAEECKNPQRDLPRSMIWSIVICTLLYIAIALVLTGMVNYKELRVGDPLAYVFDQVNLKWFAGIVAVSAVVAMASVLLVFQMGQPRIWMSMSRDGLLPPKFSKIHPKYKTPSFATIVTGFVVAIPALFMNLTMVTDLCSIGTLFAFSLVCAGVLVLQDKDIPRGKFRIPYVNGKYILPVGFIVGLLSVFIWNKNGVEAFVYNAPQVYEPTPFVTQLSKQEADQMIHYLQMNDAINPDQFTNDLEAMLTSVHEKSADAYTVLIEKAPVQKHLKFETGFNLFKHKIPMWLFLFSMVFLCIWSFKKNLSLIPMLGLICCMYMMAELTIWNWLYFTVWLIIGLLIYFSYSRFHSKLNGK
ncbi:amino acid permease [Flavobacterium sp. CBA20B-1]|uniref:amino acid permease n=1 Tax=unclassified Flavobacterium TaxID=196869 RepID=UPI0022256AB0|nr:MULTISPECIES: amino acid permease [unclassified Flavobacterium]WCM43049.1 amino acid permease [Flavobacterium sp. CBA20B-1]